MHETVKMTRYDLRIWTLRTLGWKFTTYDYWEKSPFTGETTYKMCLEVPEGWREVPNLPELGEHIDDAIVQFNNGEPDPTTDIATAFELPNALSHDLIHEQNQGCSEYEAYFHELFLIVTGKEHLPLYLSLDDVFRLAQATPIQRCQAYYFAVTGNHVEIVE